MYRLRPKYESKIIHNTEITRFSTAQSSLKNYYCDIKRQSHVLLLTPLGQKLVYFLLRNQHLIFREHRDFSILGNFEGCKAAQKFIDKKNQIDCGVTN